MRRLHMLAAALLLLHGFAPAAMADAVGIRALPVSVPERGGEMQVSLWYPSTGDGRPEEVGGNAFFQPVAAQRDASFTVGRRPLILLSHGGLKSGPNIGAWLALRLAARGYVVAMLRQPDPHGQRPQETLYEIWLRPADAVAALDAIACDADLADHVDADRVGMLGLLVGGTSAVALAGGRLDPEAFARSCGPGGVGIDCAEFARTGVNLRAVDPGQLGASRRDGRIRAIAVVDPEFGGIFTPASLGDIAIPVRLFNLGSPETMWRGLDARGLARAIPGARYVALAGATQYSAFPECRPGAAALLAAEGEEPLCDDLGRLSRPAIHDELADRIARSFALDLSTEGTGSTGQ